MLSPSKVEVPRPISSRIRRLAEVAFLRIFATSFISTMKVDWPLDLAQMSLFDTVTDEDVIKELMEVEVNTMSPLDALNTLYRLQNKLKNRW